METTRNTINDLPVSQAECRDRMLALETCLHSMIQSNAPNTAIPSPGRGYLQNHGVSPAQGPLKNEIPTRAAAKREKRDATSIYHYTALWVTRLSHWIFWGGDSWQRLFRCNHTVARTSPGFVLVKECAMSWRFAEDVVHEMKLLASKGQLSFGDVDANGAGYLEVGLSEELFEYFSRITGCPSHAMALRNRRTIRIGTLVDRSWSYNRAQQVCFSESNSDRMLTWLT